MDKTRREGASRFSRQTSLDGGGGKVIFSEKSKKERVRKLSVVGKVSSSNRDREMGCVGFDVEDDLLRSTTSIIKRSKLPKKFFDECNRVDHASVPRKLRSAMKKRNQDSISPPFPDSKKPNCAINGTELPKKNGQQGDSEGHWRQVIVGSITKDEEEVVETLSALAVLFPSNDKTNKATVNGEISKGKSSTSPEGDDSMLVFEVHEKEERTICPSTTIEAANPSSDLEGSVRVTEEVKSLNKPSQGKQLYIELDDSVRQVNIQTVSLSSESELTYKKPSCSSTGFNVPSELSPGTGSKQPKCEETSACVIKAEIALEAAGAVTSQHGLGHTIKESKHNGSTLWPGLSSTGVHGSETQGSSLHLSAGKFPAWLGNAAYATQPGLVNNSALTEKNSAVLADRKKSWKRCSAHVSISYLTKVLQNAERKERSPMQATHLMANEGSNQVVHTAVKNLNGVRKGLSGIVSADGIVDSATQKNPDEVTNAVLLHKRLLQDQQQTSTTSGLYTLQKQSIDFLSLSAGGGGVEANYSSNKMGYGLKPSTQSRGPYLQSFAQNQTAAMPLSPQNHYSSTPFPDHLSAAAALQAQVQVPPYLGSPFWGSLQPLTTTSPKQQQQQLQQCIWAAELATQYKPGGVAAPHIPNWQNGRQDPSSMIQYAQAILPPPCSSLEVLGPKYGPILQQQQQQQQQLIAITSSLPSAKMKRQHHILPAGYGGNGGGFQPDGAPSLQLLCNEQL
ncbi:uncharacterized protein LOC132279059 isoform X2 [Cornus florida]|uniref:uncharacterized protein LOC132279059 isoform X2 n=1 Tax=Cornus florida TaxID=4283 RepID=UPI00289E6C84|nr:uncharacterized protein LOC132279059 isoform X2 [Cornus florida]